MTVKVVDSKIVQKQVMQCLSLRAKETKDCELSVQEESK